MAADPAARLELVLGPARSGKSRWAEHRAEASGLAVVYVATGPSLPDDAAWQRRLARHRDRRPAAWLTLETPDPAQLGPALTGLGAGQLALVDSLGSWVAAGLELDATTWAGLCNDLLARLPQLACALIVVSEQAGWGVVPATAVGGLFRDRLGAIERRLVAAAPSSWLVVAGRALPLSAIGQPVPPD